MSCMLGIVQENLHVPVGAIPEASLEQLDPDDSEHEKEEDGDEEDVPNVLHSDDHTLHHVLQTLRSVDRSANGRMFQIKEVVFFRIISECKLSPEGTQNPKNPQNLHDGDRTRADGGKHLKLGIGRRGEGRTFISNLILMQL